MTTDRLIIMGFSSVIKDPNSTPNQRLRATILLAKYKGKLLDEDVSGRPIDPPKPDFDVTGLKHLLDEENDEK